MSKSSSSSSSSSSIKYPPGPHSILPNKLLRKFIHNPIKTLMDIAYTYGDIAHFKFGRQQHVYLINNPHYIEDILIRSYKNFIKSRGLQVSKRLLGEGLVTSEGEYHDRQRKIIQPAFHPNHIKRYGDIMTTYAVNMCQRWKDGITLDIHKEMINVTSAIISKAVLGSDIKSEEEGDQVGDAFLTCSKYFNRLLMPFGELIEKIPILPINKGFQAAKNKLDSIVYSMIKEHRDNESKAISQGGDLLYTLLQAQDAEAAIGQMTDSQLRDEVMTIFLAGHETTANALTWTFYLLSQNPIIEAKLYEELCSVLDNDKDRRRIPTIDDVPKLEYTEKVFRESMRLYPPAWTIGRQAINDYKVDKYVIPAGSIILMSQYVMHHNPLYYSDPDLFYPDRWTKEAKSQLPRFSYFPFGGGIRGCVGEPFAWMEGVLLIATVCQQWKMHHDDRDHNKVELKPLITLRPKHGMRMKLERRK
ncbi:MAG TPA: cytochrome P450 [Nitrososphaeraceae archaeon]|jgi:cytochrome P450|nr:cytochrome P450 [Nitrososphaeraceae archaeon]